MNRTEDAEIAAAWESELQLREILKGLTQVQDNLCTYTEPRVAAEAATHIGSHFTCLTPCPESMREVYRCACNMPSAKVVLNPSRVN